MENLNLPKGKGQFIYMLDRMGTPEELVDYLKGLGVQWVCVKLQNGIYISDGRNATEFEDMNPDAYVQAIKDAGIEFHAWGYFFSSSDSLANKEVQTAKSVVERFKPLTFTMNCEAEWKKIPQARAISTAKQVKEIVGVPVGFSTYRFISYHKEFPWIAFADFDFALVQVYWIKDNRVDGSALQLAVSYTQYQENSFTKNAVYIPVGCLYEYEGWWPTVEQIKLFYEAVIEMGFNAWLWWEVYYTKLKPEFAEVIKNNPGIDLDEQEEPSGDDQNDDASGGNNANDSVLVLLIDSSIKKLAEKIEGLQSVVDMLSEIKQKLEEDQEND